MEPIWGMAPFPTRIHPWLRPTKIPVLTYSCWISYRTRTFVCSLIEFRSTRRCLYPFKHRNYLLTSFICEFTITVLIVQYNVVIIIIWLCECSCRPNASENIGDYVKILLLSIFYLYTTRITITPSSMLGLAYWFSVELLLIRFLPSAPKHDDWY